MLCEHILIVDDDEGIRESLAEVIRDFGFKVKAVSNGAEALAAVFTMPRPVLVIIDLFMPVMDGKELIRKLRGHEGIRMIAMTASKNEEVLGTFTIYKPFDIEFILSKIHEHC